MKKQQLKMPKINEKATRKRVESLLEKYREYLITLPSNIQPKLTQSYSIVAPNFSNQFRSQTENIALERIEYEEARNKFINTILEAAERLKEDERFIIYNRFLQQGEGYDMDIWTELGVGKTKYYRIKAEALLRLAFLLKVEVYQQEARRQ